MPAIQRERERLKEGAECKSSGTTHMADLFLLCSGQTHTHLRQACDFRTELFFLWECDAQRIPVPSFVMCILATITHSCTSLSRLWMIPLMDTCNNDAQMMRYAIVNRGSSSLADYASSFFPGTLVFYRSNSFVC